MAEDAVAEEVDAVCRHNQELDVNLKPLSRQVRCRSPAAMPTLGTPALAGYGCSTTLTFTASQEAPRRRSHARAHGVPVSGRAARGNGGHPGISLRRVPFRPEAAGQVTTSILRVEAIGTTKVREGQRISN